VPCKTSKQCHDDRVTNLTECVSGWWEMTTEHHHHHPHQHHLYQLMSLTRCWMMTSPCWPQYVDQVHMMTTKVTTTDRYDKIKIKEVYRPFMETHPLRATEHHLPHGITPATRHKCLLTRCFQYSEIQTNNNRNRRQLDCHRKLHSVS